MGKNHLQRAPHQRKLRRIILMRVAFILLLIGNGISLFTSIASSLYSLSVHLGEDELYFFMRIRTFSNSLTLVSAALGLAGGILLLFSLAKIGEYGSSKLKRNSKLAFILLLIGLALNFAFSYVLSSLELWEVLDGQAIDTLLSITPLLTIGVDSAFYIFLGFTIRQIKREHQVGDRSLITTFIYPITFVLRLLLLFDIFSSIIAGIIASLVVSILGLVILTVFFSRGLVGLKSVINRIRSEPQSTILPSRRDGRFCAKCGSAIERIASFCANCGHPIE